jgi:hypothetical protein
LQPKRLTNKQIVLISRKQRNIIFLPVEALIKVLEIDSSSLDGRGLGEGTFWTFARASVL